MPTHSFLESHSLKKGFSFVSIVAMSSVASRYTEYSRFLGFVLSITCE